MNMLIFLALFFIRNVTPHVDYCQDTIYMKIPFAKKLSTRHIKVIISVSSAQKCLEQCRDHESCKSVGIDTSSMICYLYDGRVYAGLPLTDNFDMIYYWKLEAECPLHLGYTEDSISKMCTKFNSTGANWLDAQATCEEEGGHLLIPDTTEKMMTNYALSNGEMLVGSTTVGDTVWYWLNGSPVNTSQFNENEPNDLLGNENCLSIKEHLNNVGLNDLPCSLRFSFVCEIPTRIQYPS